MAELIELEEPIIEGNIAVMHEKREIKTIELIRIRAKKSLIRAPSFIPAEAETVPQICRKSDTPKKGGRTTAGVKLGESAAVALAV